MSEMQDKNDQKRDKIDWWKERTGLNLDEHDSYPHDFLTDFFGQCINGDGKDVRVLVPLCGKSGADIKWLYDEGYRVYGVDSSEKALQKIFTGYNMKYSYTAAKPDGFGVLKSHDERIKLFCGDFLRFSKTAAGCLFDVIWDRSAFMTVNTEDRESYIDVLRKLLLPTGRILLAAFVYDTSKWNGPPYAISCDDVHRNFDRNFHVNKLKVQDILQTWHQKNWAIDWLKEIGYMISVKT